MAKLRGPRGKRGRRPWRRRAVVEALEPRVLLSADLPGEALDAALPPPHDPMGATEIVELVSMRDGDGVASEQHASHRELVFVDAGVEDHQKLLDDLLGRSVEVRVLDAERDGIEQIGEILAAYNGDLDAVHLVSHGTDQGVQLGDTWLTAESLPDSAESLAAWRGALTDRADLLLYGCNLAGSSEGQALVNALATLTGADVAASTDLTGAAALGGDWELEYTAGSVEAFVALAPAERLGFSGILDGTAIWSESGSPTPETNSFDGSSFGTPTATADVGGPWVIMDGAEAPTRDEKIVIGVDSGGTLSGMRWDGTSWIAPPFTDFATVSNSERWGFGVEYESQSGRAMLVFNNGSSGTAGLSYWIWDGTTISDTGTFTTPFAGEPQQLRLAASPDSNEMVLVVSNENNEDYALVWDGASWGNSILLDDGGGSTYNTEVQVAYEQLSGHAMVVYGKNSKDAFFRIWNGSAWEAEVPIDAPGAASGQVIFTSLAADPGSDRIALGVLAANNNSWLAMWNGAAWDPSVQAAWFAGGWDAPAIAVAFESTGGDAIATYADDSSSVLYQTWSPGGGWSGEQIGPDLGQQPRSMTLDPDPGSDAVMLSVLEQGGNVSYVAWNGSSWGAPSEQELNSGTDKLQPFLFLWDQTANNAPTADAGGPYDIAEGDPVTLDASSSADLDGDSLTYAWDIDGDMTYGDVTGVSPTLTWAELRGFGIDDDGAHTVSVRVGDGKGGFDIGSATINVANTAPTLTVSGPDNVDEDAVYTLNLSATDPGNETRSWTINWGDGTIDTVGDVPSATHVYTQGGFTHNITVSVTDEDGTYAPGNVFLSSNNTDSLFCLDGTTGGLLEEFADLDGFTNPVDVEIGPDGLIYATGFASNDVRRYHPVTGTFLGPFVAPGSGGLSAPSRMAFGPDGHLYVTSYNTDEVLRFDGATGAFIDEFVTAGSGALNRPDAISFGPDGNLYVSSDADGTILRYDGTSGDLIDTFATVGSTGYTDLTFGPDGNLYVSNVPLNKVQRFDGATGAKIDDFVAAGSGGISGAAGLLFGPDNYLYVVGFTSDNVLRYRASDGSFFDEFIKPAAGQQQPINLAFAPARQVLVNHRADTPTVTAAVTDENTQTSSGLVIDRNSIDHSEVTHFKITNITNGTLYQNDGSTVINDGDFITFAEGNAGLKFTPALDYSGPASFEVQASTSGDDTDLSAAATASITVTAVNDTPTADAGGPYDIAEGDPVTLDASSSTDLDGDSLTYAWDIDGDMSYGDVTGVSPTLTWAQLRGFGIDDDGAHTVSVRVDDGKGGVDTVSATINVANTAPTLTVSGPASVDEDAVYTLDLSAIDPGDDTITGWTINWGDGTIDTVGDVPSATHVYTQSGFTRNITVSATDEDGTFTNSDLIVGSWRNDSNDIFRFDGTTGALDSIFDSAGQTLDRPFYAMVGPDGNYYLSAFDTDKVVRFDATGTYLDTFIPAGSNGLDSPVGLAFGPDGNLYVASYGSSEILRFDASGNFLDVFGSGGQLDGPSGIAFGPDGDLYVANYGNSMLVKLDGAAGGTPTTLTGGLGKPEQIAFDGAGVLYIASESGDSVMRWDGAAATTYFTDPGLDEASGLTFGPDGWLYVSSLSTDRIFRFDGTTTQTFVTPGSGGLDQPAYLSFTPDQQVLVNHRADIPAVTAAVTQEDTQTSSGLVVDRNASDGLEVTHFKITNIANGTLYQNDGTTVINDGDFISFAEGNAGLRFTPALDYSGTASFEVQASTTGDDTDLSAAATASIAVTAVNDAPTSTDAAFVLAENSADGTVVGSVSASDVDAGDSLSYAITAGDPSGAFTIDAATGEITVADSTQLDFETSPVFNLTVTVTDTGGLTDDAAVTVSLTDVNEVPVATDAAFVLAENSGNGTVVGSVSASDVDAGDSLSYAITNGNASGVFSIDSATGEITVADSTQLDFETTPVFNLTVTVTDAGGLTDDAAVTVSLTDVNEVPVATDAAFVLAENSGDGTVVGSVSASDVDAGDSVSYAITAGNASGAFTIDAATGEITVNDAAQLNFETSPVFNLTVTVTDSGGLTDDAAVTVSLTDVNEAPTAVDAAFVLAENSGDGTVVGSVSASDVDAGDSVSYAITAGNASGAFTIDAATGEITVNDAAQLNFETSPVFNLTVTVTDAGGLTDDAAVTVSLTDVNEVPVATDAAFVLAENSGNGTVVGSVSASDVDAGDSLSYAITNGNASGVFSIDSATGEITVADSTQLDFETTPVFNLTVTVTDAGGLTDDAAVTVSLTDVNEVPVATDAAFVLAENSGDGTVVGSVSASDVDAGDSVSYAITAGNASGAFTIDAATGEITVNDAAQLNFETSPVFNLTVTVTDSGGLTDDAAVTVSLTDVNEAPTAVDAAFVLAENSGDGTVVGSVSASDVDAGDSVSYAITAGNASGAFTIDAATGEITVNDAAQLNFETSPVFNLTVTVTDAGGLTDDAAVTVSLTDVNEAPTATDAAFVLAENSGDGTVVGSVSASDVDAGDSVSYAITAGNASGAFTIDAATGEITVNDAAQLNFETSPVFNLTVTVTDAGGLTDDAAVTVSLTDVNEAPTATDAAFVLAENSGDGTVVGSVSASDVDAGDSVSYAITAGNASGAFTIDAATGEITVNDAAQLNFETSPVFNLTVTVTDSGGLTDDAAVTVSLTDVNEAPTAVDAAFVLAENSGDGTVVGSVSASDVDAGDSVSYAITAGNASGAFTIDAATGEITVNDAAQLDFETSPVFNLTVTVTDAGSLTDDAAVAISLADLNEAPTASDASFVLAENSVDGTLVGTVSASDVDAGDSVSYAITAGNASGAFTIDAATGEITVNDAAQLNFETSPVFNLTVTVTDAGGLTDDAAVAISLADLNEAPTATDAAFVLAENSGDGTVVGSVSASDVDAGDSVSYAITAGNASGAFTIDAATGEITVNDAAQLNFETSPVFNLTVTVTDAGGLTDDAAVTVSLTDVNEAPTAVDAAFVLAENSGDGTVVGSVSASDVDAGDSVSYAITAGNASGAFTIDAATGEITVNDAAQLDFETSPVFNLTVTVTDAGSLTDDAAVAISLADLNEAPTASDASFVLAENSVDGTLVGTVSASDVDAGDTLSYAITAGDLGAAFAIDAATGEITVADASQLGFETTPVFNLTVTVTDAGGLTDTAAVTVSLTDVNEAPVLTPVGPTLPSITEDDTDNAGVRVSSILGPSVSDADTGAVRGIAITSLSSGNGTWQYQVGTGPWRNVGAVSDNFALLLQATDRVRFVPDGHNADAASFTYRAWDRTSGAAGAKVRASVNGGATAFSIATDIASISVIAVNDAPHVGDAALAAVAEGTASPPGETVVELFAGRVSDVDVGSGFAGIAVVGNGADPGVQGVWEYSTDGGASWFAIGSVADDATALVLSADTLVRFVPAADFDGVPSALVVRGMDDTYAGGFSSTAGGSQTRVNVDTASNGGTSAIAGRTATLSTSITAGEPSDPPREEIIDEPIDITTDPEDEGVPETDPTSTDETPESPIADAGLPDVSAAPTEPIVVISPVPVGGLSIDLSHQANVEYDTRSDALSVARTTIEVFQRIFENGPLIVPGGSLTDLIYEQTELMEDLDRLQEEIESFVGLEMTVAGSSIAVTMGLSIGYVIWLTRGGLLLASLLSSLPAWRLIDPIAVLAHLGTDDEDDRDDEESLDSLLSRSSRPEGSRLWRPEPKRVEEHRNESPAAGTDDVPPEQDLARREEG